MNLLIGTLIGICTLQAPNQPVQSFPFIVPPDSQANLGYLGTDSGPGYGHYVINIVNNTSAEEKEKSWGFAVAIGFSREGDNIFRNPSGQNDPPIEYSWRDAFTVSPSSGAVVLEPITGRFDKDGNMAFHTVAYRSDRLKDEFSFETPVAQLGGIDASCSATFNLENN